MINIEKKHKCIIRICAFSSFPYSKYVRSSSIGNKIFYQKRSLLLTYIVYNRSIVTLVQWLQLDNKGLNVLSSQLKQLGTIGDTCAEGGASDLARKLKQMEGAALLYNQKLSPDVTRGSKLLSYHWYFAFGPLVFEEYFDLTDFRLKNSM